jgi:hypothetical protein
LQLAGADGKVVQASKADIKWYQSVVGSLLYAALHTRVDIAQAVHRLSHFVNNPQPHHCKAAIRVLRYLAGTHTLALKFDKNATGSHELPADKVGSTASMSSIGRKSSTNTSIGTNGINISIRAYCDADWAGDHDTRRSTTGTLIMVNNNVVHWASTRQPIVATSSAEAEYIALSNTAKEIKWFNNWLGEVNLLVPNEYQLTKPTTVHVDNTAAIALAGHDAGHSRTKHIDVRYHFVREMVDDGTVAIQWTPTQHQLADLLTKRLPTEPFQAAVKKLLVHTKSIVDIVPTGPRVNKASAA